MNTFQLKVVSQLSKVQFGRTVEAAILLASRRAGFDGEAC
jgi:hypothetical protein